MGGRRALRRDSRSSRPTARLVLVLGQELTARQLIRAVPEINRVAIGIIKAQARRDQPITSSSAVRYGGRHPAGAEQPAASTEGA